MSEHGLTNDERRCLQMWFRQAVATLETEETAHRLAQWFAEDDGPTHRSGVSRRRARHTVAASHGKEIAAL